MTKKRPLPRTWGATDYDDDGHLKAPWWAWGSLLWFMLPWWLLLWGVVVRHTLPVFPALYPSYPDMAAALILSVPAAVTAGMYSVRGWYPAVFRLSGVMLVVCQVAELLRLLSVLLRESPDAGGGQLVMSNMLISTGILLGTGLSVRIRGVMRL